MPWTLRMTVFTMIIGFLPYLYIYLRLGSSLKLLLRLQRRTVLLIMALIYLIFHLYPLTYLLYSMFGNGDNFFVNRDSLSWADYLIHFPYWIGFITVIDSFGYFIMIDLLQYLLRRFSFGKNLYRPRPWAHGRIVFYILFLFYVAIRSYYDTNSIRDTSYTINLPHAPAGIEDLKFTFFADLQVDRYTTQSKINAFKTNLKKSDPDFIFFAGDLITSGRAFTKKAVAAVCDGDTSIPRIACMGDHDFWNDRDAIVQGLEKGGWDFLQNAHKVYQYKNLKILVTGITQIYSRRISPSELDALLDAAPDADLKVLLVHQPRSNLIQSADKHGYNLFLAGHTHGGQMVFKPLGFTITPTQFENPIYTGHHIFNNLHVVITNGIGMTLIPLRYRAYAEIVRLNFKTGNTN